MAPWIGNVLIHADSATHEGFRIPVRNCIEGLPETVRTDIVLGKEAAVAGLT